MSTEVLSRIHASGSYAPETVNYYRSLAECLNRDACDLRAQACAWEQASLQYAQQQYQTWCMQDAQYGLSQSNSLVSGWSASPSNPSAAQSHVRLDYSGLSHAATDIATLLRELSKRCEQLGDHLSRAWSLYSDAERKSKRVVDESLQAYSVLSPFPALMMLTIGAVGGLGYGLVKEGKLNVTHMVNGTTKMQQGMLAGLGSRMTGLAPGQGAFAKDEVNQAARGLGPVLGQLNNAFQGNALHVKQVHPEREVMSASSSIEEALHGLRVLGNSFSGEEGKLHYGTIAISQYQDESGKNSWLVTIPGTDGKRDSPFGWIQNVELMSGDSATRKQADSARMVVQAMQQAGIQEGEPVVLIGHSQGGIVAATLASDYADEFNIEHIVTAGSPIANHPIDPNTWVTSIEMEDELVASLDGADNPSSSQWLTVRGQLQHVPADATIHGAQVDGKEKDESYELTHNLKYHEAAWSDASSLGSPQLQEHDHHVQECLKGDYLNTTYWQGRMAYPW